MAFEGFDLAAFWEPEDYLRGKGRNEYIYPAPSDDLVRETERKLGYKLPESYLALIKQQNGGCPARTRYDVPADKGGGMVEISGFLGIGEGEHDWYTLCGTFGSTFMIQGWNYPDIGVAVCDTPFSGHVMIFLDYRACGPQGEPSVVLIDQEDSFAITPIADSFEEFVRGLRTEDDEDDGEDEEDSQPGEHSLAALLQGMESQGMGDSPMAERIRGLLGGQG